MTWFCRTSFEFLCSLINQIQYFQFLHIHWGQYPKNHHKYFWFSYIIPLFSYFGPRLNSKDFWAREKYWRSQSPASCFPLSFHSMTQRTKYQWFEAWLMICHFCCTMWFWAEIFYRMVCPDIQIRYQSLWRIFDHSAHHLTSSWGQTNRHYLMCCSSWLNQRLHFCQVLRQSDFHICLECWFLEIGKPVFHYFLSNLDFDYGEKILIWIFIGNWDFAFFCHSSTFLVPRRIWWRSWTNSGNFDSRTRSGRLIPILWTRWGYRSTLQICSFSGFALLYLCRICRKLDSCSSTRHI